MQKEYGLVLAGGGTKGAYQVGVWKALKDLKVKIKAITGTSIGALNGALILQDNLKRMEDIYTSIQITNIMKTTKPIDQSKDLFSLSNLFNLTSDYTTQKGIENEPLRRLIVENINIDKLYKSKIDFGLVSYSVKNKKPLEKFKSEIPKEQMVEHLLASACFPIFKPQIIDGEEYYDGGLYDNAPVNMLLKQGYKNIIVADITGVGVSKKLMNKNTYIKVISPNEDIGGVFEFNHERISKNIKLGYLDTMRAFNKLQGHIYYFKVEEFSKMIEVFNLNTIYGLEYAANIYGIDKYKTYKFEEFIILLREKHIEAQNKYREIKKKFSIKKILELKEELDSILDKRLGLCLAIDIYKEKPLSRKTSYLVHYLKDYMISAKAIIELINYYE